MSLKKGLKKFGSEFAFNFFLETMHGPIIDGLKDYLSDIKPSDIPDLVAKEKFPSIDHLDLGFAADNIEHLEKISLLELVEFLAEARPDLVQAIQNMGEAGAAYMAKLRQHLISKIKNAEFKKEEDMVMVTCTSCKRKIPMPRDKVADLKECPFCHEPADGGQKPGEETET